MYLCRVGQGHKWKKNYIDTHTFPLKYIEYNIMLDMVFNGNMLRQHCSGIYDNLANVTLENRFENHLNINYQASMLANMLTQFASGLTCD